MTAREKRDELLALAAVFNDQRVALAKTIGLMNEGISALLSEADSHLIAAANEGEKPRMKDHNLTMQIAEGVMERNKGALEQLAQTGRQRKCSNCGQPGHRATTCAQRTGKPPKEKKERKKRDLTPEQRKAIGARLKAGRVKSGKK